MQALRDRYSKMKDVSKTDVFFRLQKKGVEVVNSKGDRMLMVD